MLSPAPARSALDESHRLMLTLHQVKTQLPKHTKKEEREREREKKKKEKKRLTVVHKTQSIAKVSNISIYVQLHATEKCTSRTVP